MIAQLRGVLIEKSLDRVVVECGGVGYAVLVTLNTLAELPEVGRDVTLKTHFVVREDAQLLFGFAGDAERRAFELAITVSGVGPKLALALLSSLRPESLAEAIRTGDAARIARAPGIGKRTAEKIVVELKDRVDRMGLSAGGVARPIAAAGGAPRLAGSAGLVASALVHLGYRADEAERVAREAVAGREGEPIEALVREALRALTG